MTPLHIAEKFTVKSCLFSGGMLKLLKALGKNSKRSLLIVNLLFFLLKCKICLSKCLWELTSSVKFLCKIF